MTQVPANDDACCRCPLPSWTTRLVGVFLPDFCALCERLGEVLCPVCRHLLLSAGPNADHLALYLFNDPVKHLIHRLKYGGEFWLVRVFEGAMRARAAEIDCDVVVPVPLHPRRLKERGFNQSLILARAWGKILGRPVIPNALLRIIDTPSQTGLDRGQRLKNLAGAFTVGRSEGVVGKTVILIDDVRTTGATLDTAACELKRAGAERILTATVAVVP